MKNLEEYKPTMTFNIKDLKDDKLHEFVNEKLKSNIQSILRDENKNCIIITIKNKKRQSFTIKIEGSKYDYRISYIEPKYEFLSEENRILRRHWFMYLNQLYGEDYNKHIFRFLDMIYKRGQRKQSLSKTKDEVIDHNPDSITSSNLN